MTGTRILSPSGGWAQVQPGSIAQMLEHPSPFAAFPSSHASPSTMPSPHFDVQEAPVQSGSLWQSCEQPSNGMVLPSSQPSAPSFLPSPQVVVEHLLGLPSH